MMLIKEDSLFPEGGVKSRLFTHYLGICCLILAFVIHSQTNGDLRFGKDLMFISMVSLSVILFGLKRCFIVIPFLVSSFFIEIYSAHALYQLVMVIFGVILFSQVYSYGINEEIFGNYLLWLGIIQACWFIAHYFGHDPQDFINSIYGPHGKKYFIKNGIYVEAKNVKQFIVGSLAQHTLSGIYFILALPYAWLKKWPLIVIVPAVFLTNSTMVQSSVLISFLAIYFKNIKWLFIPITMMVSLFLVNLFFPLSDYFSGQERIIAWKWAINNLEWFGNGLGHWADHFPMITKEVFKQAHSEPIEIIYAYGFIGIISIAILGSSFFSDKVYLKASLIGLLFNSLGNFPFHLASIGMIGIILLAHLTKDGLWHFQKQRNKSNYWVR